MKKIFSFGAIALAALATLGCKQELSVEVLPSASDKAAVIYATREGSSDTKTGWKPNSTDFSIVWGANNQLSVFSTDNPDPNPNMYFYIVAADYTKYVEGGYQSLKFTHSVNGEVPGTAPYVAVYPYDRSNAMVNFPNGGTLLQVPFKYAQTASAGNFDPQAYTAAAYSQTLNFDFKNVFGLLAITIGDVNVTSVKLKGNKEGSVFGGRYNIGMFESVPYCIPVEEGTVNEITLTPSEGSFTVGATYYMVVPPMSFVEGATFSIYNGTSIVGSFSTSGAVSVERNKIHSVPTLATGDFSSIAQLSSLAASAPSAGAEYTGRLTNVVVSYVPDEKNAVLKDASGSILVFKDGHGLLQGQTFSGELTVTVKQYKGLSEITAIEASFAGEQTPVAPEKVALSAISANYDKYQNAYVELAGLVVSSVSGKYAYVLLNSGDGAVGDAGAGTGSEATETYTIYQNGQNVSCVAGDIITVIGTVSKFNDPQIKVWATDGITVTGTTEVPATIDAKDITGVAAEGVTDASTTITINNGDGWTPYVTCDGTVVTSASISGSAITYSVSANTGAARDGSITVTLSKSGKNDVVKVIKVSQLAAGVSVGSGTLEDPFTIDGAIAYIDKSGSEQVYVKGKISSINNEFTVTYGNATFFISDDGETSSTQFEAYRILYLQNKKWQEGNTQIKVGDDVILYGNLTKYSNTYETAQNKAYIYSLNGVTSEFSPATIEANDIANVPAAGVTNSTLEIKIENGDGWNASVTPDGTVVTAASINGNVITYSVAANTGAARDGKIVVTLKMDGKDDVVKEIKVSQVAAGATDSVYQKYSGSLAEGDYLIVYSGKAMKAEINSKRFAYSEVKEGDSITNPNASIVWHIAKSGDYWTIYNASTKQFAAGNGTKNQGALISTLAGTGDAAYGDGLWTASGTETYEFVNVLNTSKGVNSTLRNNTTYGFACYSTSTGGELTLYKLK